MPRQPLFVGDPALIVIDIQRGISMPPDIAGVTHMPGWQERLQRAEQLVAAAREVEDCVGGSNQARHDVAVEAMDYLQAGARRTTAQILDAYARLAAERSPAPAETLI
ncbi:MAG: biuret amidohydrolase [Streptomycetaceae bacterium]|nr:biuret amidohydrolase [Streptomycetaceae bacterium]